MKMIKFKILCLICLCFVLTQVIGVEKYANSTVDSHHSSFKNVGFKNDKLPPHHHSSNTSSDNKSAPIKKNDKMQLKEEKFQVLKAGSENIQLQKNAMQNSFQSVYGQAFVVNESPPSSRQSPSRNRTSSKGPTFRVHHPIIKPWPKHPMIVPARQPNQLPKPPQPPVKQEPPVYHFNKRPIVYQCCRYVFPAELYMDHLLFYFKYGNTYNINPNENARKPDHANQVDQSSKEIVGNVEFLEKEPLDKESIIKQPDDEAKDVQKLNDKLVENNSKADYSNQRSKSEHSDGEEEESHGERTHDQGGHSEGTHENSHGRTKENLSKRSKSHEAHNEKSHQQSNEKHHDSHDAHQEKSHEQNDKSHDQHHKDDHDNHHEKSSDKSHDKHYDKHFEKGQDGLHNKLHDKSEEPDQAATFQFNTWKASNRNLVNFGSCTPIYDLGQTNTPNSWTPHQPRSRWPFFG